MAGSGQVGAGRDHTAVVVGILLLLVAGVLWYDANAISRTVAYGVGPGVMPKIIGAGLALLGLLSIVSGFRGEAESVEATDWLAVFIVIGGFIALTVIIGLGGGFLIAMAILFAATSFAFGRRAVLADLALGGLLALLTYLLFTKGLALSLPQGPLERLIG